MCLQLCKNKIIRQETKKSPAGCALLFPFNSYGCEMSSFQGQTLNFTSKTHNNSENQTHDSERKQHLLRNKSIPLNI